MITIIFESHGTTSDNEDHLSSGHYDVELSELGKRVMIIGHRAIQYGLAAIPTIVKATNILIQKLLGSG